MGRIPDRWEEYEPVGKPITGTRFISFKVPLQEMLCRYMRPDLWFTPKLLIDQLKSDGHQLGLVIDLTNTKRYYQDTEILSAGIDYVKIFTEGHVVPSAAVQKTFSDAVDNFLKLNADNNLLIGVHCTHGLNRTGYLVCRYMINKMSFEPQVAIDAFNVARGYSIERVNYLNDLLGIEDSVLQSPQLEASLEETTKKTSWKSRESAAGTTTTADQQRVYGDWRQPSSVEHSDYVDTGRLRSRRYVAAGHSQELSYTSTPEYQVERYNADHRSTASQPQQWHQDDYNVYDDSTAGWQEVKRRRPHPSHDSHNRERFCDDDYSSCHWSSQRRQHPRDQQSEYYQHRAGQHSGYKRHAEDDRYDRQRQRHS